MKKSILNIGSVLKKEEQQKINGGDGCPNPNSCQENPCGICPEGMWFHQNSCQCYRLF